MKAPGHNEGFYVLDEFVCEAIHIPSVPLANPANQGRNEGMSVVEELLFDADQDATSEDVDDPTIRRPLRSVALDDAIKSEVGRLATLISVSADRIGTLALVQKLLLAEVNNIQRSE